MSWKDNLLPASFRGIGFFVQSSDYVTGRRTTQHEFPDRDEPFAEDLGKISDSFKVDGYIIGDDYFEIRNQLIDAFQKEGPGKLNHPYYGIKFVQSGSVSFKETLEEGRMVRFSVSFKEAGENRFPKSSDDKGAKLLEATDNALTEAQNDFAEKFVTKDQPGFSLDAARDWIGNAQTAYNSATSDVATTADGIAELAFSTRNLVAETEDLLQSPAKLANRLLSSLSLITNAVTSSLDAFSSYKSLFGFGDNDPVPIETTPTRQQIKQNKTTFDGYMKLTAALKGAEEAGNATWNSLDDAKSARDDLLAIFDGVTDTTDNDELYQSIKDVTSTLINLLPDEDAELPQTKTLDINNTVDTLNITYDLFENVDNEQDIIDRNNISNPAFVESGKTLEIIDGRRQSQN